MHAEIARRARRGEASMIRCVRLWTGEDRNSHVDEGHIDLELGRGAGSLPVAAATVSFRETEPGGAYDWHTAPVRQLVMTLSGTLRFETRGGETFVLRPGDVLLAEDTTGSGHRWSLMDDQPWRRAYVVLPPDAEVPFVVSQCRPFGKG